MPTRTTPIAARRPLAQTTRIAALTTALLAAGVALAGPALAIDDPSRPDARVTQAPSCHPGGVVIEITAGTTAYSVRLATTRMPQGEDEATVQPGETVVLQTGDVVWGETIDSRLEYTALDGSGTTYVDELENYSFTRPTEQDCAAIAPAPAPAAPASQAPAAVPGPAAGAAPASSSADAPAVEPAGDVGLPPASGDDDAPPGPADPGTTTVDGGVQPQPVAATGAVRLDAPVATVAERRGVTSWPLFFATLSLLGSATGLVLVSIRWWLLGRRSIRSG